MVYNYLKKINLKLEHLLIVGLIVAILPFILLAFFNNPAADDFSFSVQAIKFGFWKAQILWRNGWTGRYFSSAILSLSPLVFKSLIGYKVIPLILMFFLFSSLYMFINELILGYLSVKKRLIAALLIFILYIYQMPALAEGFYWLSGSINYQLGNIFMLYLFTMIIRLLKTEKPFKKAIFIFLSIFLIFAIVGLNEVAMMTLQLLLLSILIADIMINRKVSWILLFLVIIAAICCYIVISAPGNAVRLAHFINKHKLTFSIYSSVLQTFYNIYHWIAFSPILLFTILFIPIISAEVSKKKAMAKDYISFNPIFPVGLFLTLIFISFFTAYWSTGDPPPRRTINTIYLLFLIGWFLNMYIIIHYLNLNAKFKIQFYKLPNYALILISFLIILNFLKRDNNIRIAYADLIKGTAYRYNKELGERYKAILASKSDACEVDSLKNYPRTIFFDDIESDGKDWKNVVYAAYFHKKTIVLKKPSIQK